MHRDLGGWWGPHWLAWNSNLTACGMNIERLRRGDRMPEGKRCPACEQLPPIERERSRKSLAHPTSPDPLFITPEARLTAFSVSLPAWSVRLRERWGLTDYGLLPRNGAVRSTLDYGFVHTYAARRSHKKPAVWHGLARFLKTLSSLEHEVAWRSLPPEWTGA